MKRISTLLLTLIFISSCKSTTSASDASVTAGFILVVIICLIIFVGGIYGNWEEAQQKKEEQRREEEQRKFYYSPKEVEKRENIKKLKEEEHKLFVKNNPHLSNSYISLNDSIDLLANKTPNCKKCDGVNFTLWELQETSLTIRCDSCKRKTINTNEISNKIFSNFINYLKWEEYCENNNTQLTYFKFNKENFRANTPLHRGIKFKGMAKEQIELKDNNSEDKKSRRITQDVKDKVWNRDGGKCVECDSNESLEFDHIIPHSKGGANTYRNIQLLCEPCNRSKSAKIG